MKQLRINTNPSKLTIKEGYELFINHCKVRNLRPDSIKHYEEVIKSIRKHIPDETLISTINKETVDKFILDVQATGVSENTVYCYTRDLRTILNYFMSKDYLPKFKVNLPKISQKQVETYTDTELEKLLVKPDLKKCRFTYYRSWVITNFLLSTGIRSKSLLELKIGCLDLEEGIVRLNHTKNRKSQIIPLNKTIVKIMQEYLEIRGGDKDDYLFCNAYGGKLGKSTLNGALDRYNRSRNVTTTGVHRYRHTFAKKFILSGGSVTVLQKLLSHSSLEMTQKYVNLLVSDVKSEVEEFDILKQFKNEKKSIKMK